MFTVVGLKNVVSKKDGTRYVELHLLTEDRFIDGQRCEIVFCRVDQVKNFNSLCIGAIVQVYFNRFGRVESVEIV